MKHPIFRLQLKYCTEEVRETLDALQHLVFKLDPLFVTPEHMLLCVLTHGLRNYLPKSKIDVEPWMDEMCQYISKLSTRTESMDTLDVLLSVQMDEVLDHLTEQQNHASAAINGTEHPVIGIIDVLMAMVQLEDSVAAQSISHYLGDTHEALEMRLQTNERGNDDEWKQLSQRMDSVLNMLGQMSNLAARAIHDGDAMPGQASGHSRQGAAHNEEPWRKLVRKLYPYMLDHPHVVGRVDEINRAKRILFRCHKNNVVLVGEHGVGKTCIMKAIALSIVKDDEKCNAHPTDIYAMDMTQVMAGVNSPGDFDHRIRMLMNGLISSTSNPSILCVENLSSLCDSTGTLRCALDIMDSFLGYKISIIGTATYKEYNKMMTSNPNFARHFHMIEVKEDSIDNVLEQIEMEVMDYAMMHGCTYRHDAVEYAVRQSVEVMRDRFLPEKALDILDEAGSYRQLHPRMNKKGVPMQRHHQFVTREIVQTVIADMCRLDAKVLKEVGNESLKNLQDNVTSLIYGQDDAVQQVVRAVMMAKAGLTEPGKPMASLLFVGPTGVGKTELCRVLADQLGVELVRFDMSEYMEKYSVSKLIGSPAGYVGYDEGGLLTGAVRRSPNCVLLLDEIEKAHPDIYNVLLQVMDYARLTDNKGGKVDFSHVILVMTSNAGAQHADRSAIGFAGGQSRGQAMLAEVKKVFKPEFLNRLTGTVVFHDMDRHMASLILDKKVRQLAERLQTRGVSLKLMPDAQEFMLQQGYSAQYGAREMDRAIQQYLMPMLTDAVLFGSLREGGSASICMRDGVLHLSSVADGRASAKSKKKQ